jgi:hypothetical protein
LPRDEAGELFFSGRHRQFLQSASILP